jgi:hypothetical protein
VRPARHSAKWQNNGSICWFTTLRDTQQLMLAYGLIHRVLLELTPYSLGASSIGCAKKASVRSSVQYASSIGRISIEGNSNCRGRHIYVTALPPLETRRSFTSEHSS